MEDALKDFISKIPITKFLNNAGNRKLVIWGKGAIGEKLLSVLARGGGERVSYIIDTKPFPSDFHGIKVVSPDYLKGKKSEFYCIVAIRNYYQDVEDYLKEIGYEEIMDYFFLFHKPIVIEKEQPYVDSYGNEIIGEAGMVVPITAYDSKLELYSSINSNLKIHICNSRLHIGENFTVEEGEAYIFHNADVRFGAGNIIKSRLLLFCYEDSSVYTEENVSFGNEAGIFSYVKSSVKIEADSYFQDQCQLVGSNNSKVQIYKKTHFEDGCRLLCRDFSKIFVGIDGYFNKEATLCANGHSILQIGNTCNVQRFFNCVSSFGGLLKIGDDFMASFYVSIYNNDGHPIFDLENLTQINKNRDIQIGTHVWAGIKSTILSGSVIGESCVIGANSVVNKQFPNNCTIAGIPARILRKNIAWEIEENHINRKYWNLTEDV